MDNDLGKPYMVESLCEDSSKCANYNFNSNWLCDSCIKALSYPPKNKLTNNLS
jgi:hypothetical protein